MLFIEDIKSLKTYKMRKLLLAISIRHSHFLPIYPQASGKLHISTISVKTKKQLLVPI